MSEMSQATREVDVDSLNNLEFRQCNSLITNVRYVPVSQGKSESQLSVADKRTRFSLYEQRMIYFLATQIGNADPKEIEGGLDGSEETFVWWFQTKDVAEGCGLPNSCKANEIKRIVGKLRNTEILVEDDAGKQVSQTSFVLKANYRSNGTVGLVIDKGILPFYHRLLVKSNFTPFLLRYLNSLKSIHGVNLYMYLKYKFNHAVNLGAMQGGSVNVSVEIGELRKILHVDDIASYKRLSSFKARVLDKAEAEINERTDLKISYSVQRQLLGGNHLNFVIEANDIVNSGQVSRKALQATMLSEKDVLATDVTEGELIALFKEAGITHGTGKLFIKQFENNMLGLYSVAMYVINDAKDIKNVYNYFKDLMTKFADNPNNVIGALKYYHERIRATAEEQEVIVEQLDLAELISSFIQNIQASYSAKLSKESVITGEFDRQTDLLLEKNQIADLEELTALYYEEGKVRDIKLKRKLSSLAIRGERFSEEKLAEFVESSVEWKHAVDQIADRFAECEEIYTGVLAG